MPARDCNLCGPNPTARAPRKGSATESKRPARTTTATRRSTESHSLARLVGNSRAFLDVVAQLPALAGSTASVIITGETGTGKELVARALHYAGPRAADPFIPVNCGSLPDSLLEDELFGHERGAFTDARAKREGLIVQAHGGTLFLDEIDSLSPRAQVTLLRVLQDRTVRALGSERSREVDVRFIAATNASLENLVARGEFRSDLYYRLCVVPLNLPPLRERREDVLLLAQHFLERYRGADAPQYTLTSDAESALLMHPWPGNVRELENAVQRAITLARTATLAPRDLGLATSTPTPLPPAATPSLKSDSLAQQQPFREAKQAMIEAFEREYLTRLLQTHYGNVSRAARTARKERRDLGRLLKKHALDPRAFAR